jgi:hypothetical protein
VQRGEGRSNVSPNGLVERTFNDEILMGFPVVERTVEPGGGRGQGGQGRLLCGVYLVLSFL